ncbi:MAG: hypothetical protein IKQ76_00275 [Bacteroidales bacterium]|nr:hypothetical protein [Bacteroidales bacterium]
MKEELLFLGIVFILSLIFYAFYSVIKRIVTAIKEKKYEWASVEFLILLAIIALCVFVVKPFQLAESLVALFTAA